MTFTLSLKKSSASYSYKISGHEQTFPNEIIILGIKNAHGQIFLRKQWDKGRLGIKTLVKTNTYNYFFILPVWDHFKLFYYLLILKRLTYIDYTC